MAGRTIRFTCSEHGEQKFERFSHASIHLACGCAWSDRLAGELVPIMYQQSGRWREPYPALIPDDVLVNTDRAED